MRKILGMAAAAALALLLPPLAGAAHGQCATGCSSSSSCQGTGKANCSTACGTTKGTGSWCSCTDEKCAVAPLPPATLLWTPGATLASHEGGALPLAASLVADCRGNFVDVLIVRSGGGPAFFDLPAITFRKAPSATPARMAARE